MGIAMEMVECKIITRGLQSSKGAQPAGRRAGRMPTLKMAAVDILATAEKLARAHNSPQ
jgi:hypothetical protein